MLPQAELLWVSSQEVISAKTGPRMLPCFSNSLWLLQQSCSDESTQQISMVFRRCIKSNFLGVAF